MAHDEVGVGEVRGDNNTNDNDKQFIIVLAHVTRAKFVANF